MEELIKQILSERDFIITEIDGVLTIKTISSSSISLMRGIGDGSSVNPPKRDELLNDVVVQRGIGDGSSVNPPKKIN